ncbi:hypothetical protein GZ346_001870 [Salmonella enterica]|nr:hypothetical protein [Salmonella enterica]ROC44150.1 hypothetical protein C4Z30_023060 [Klebsiella pneumoniae subsp. pneumoniae]ROF49741.1 hypothetical protein C4Y73_026950 [Klebsiella pneumoniae subsp. pneumoniae]
MRDLFAFRQCSAYYIQVSCGEFPIRAELPAPRRDSKKSRPHQSVFLRLVITVRYVNSEVLRGELGARIYERAPEQCRDNKPSPVKEIFRHCPVR